MCIYTHVYVYFYGYTYLILRYLGYTNMGALIIRIGFSGPSYYSYNKGTSRPQKIV